MEYPLCFAGCCFHLFHYPCDSLEIDVANRSTRDTGVTIGPRLISAAWCVAITMLDVVADFLVKGEFRGDLIEKWQEAFQLLEAVNKGLPLQASTYHTGSCLCVCTLDDALPLFLI